VDTVKNQGLRKSVVSYSPPLITEKRVIAANSIDGIKAYDKKRGRLIWDFPIPLAGVSRPLTLDKGILYFGGRDGFFYSLDEETGTLRWKYYIGSELAGQALVHEGRLYFLTQDQKLYALDLKGQLVWIHSHQPVESDKMTIRVNKKPFAKEGLIYASFENTVLKALQTKDAKMISIWRVFSGESIIETLKKEEDCLLASVSSPQNYYLEFKSRVVRVPLLETYKYCVNLKNKKIQRMVLEAPYEIMKKSFAKNLALHQFHLKASDFKNIKAQKALLNSKKEEEKKQLTSKEKKTLEEIQLPLAYLFPPSFFKDYFIFGSTSYGKLQMGKIGESEFLMEYPFGKGLAAPVSVDPVDQSLYFLSVDAYLHKISYGR